MIAPVGNVLDQIQRAQLNLSASEQKVAAVVLTQPEEVIYWTLADLARAAEVSEPTVLRFCRSLDIGGFQDFRVRLAQSVVTHFPYAAVPIEPNDSTNGYLSKVFQSTIDTIVEVHTQLDAEAVERAVGAISEARKLVFFGIGASGSVALDAYHKFFRLITDCVAYTDSHMQFIAAATLDHRDVLVAISHTGRTRELIEGVEVAARRGARVIAITTPSSPLARSASIVLPAAVPEDTDLYTPMVSRIAHLVIIDSLAVGVAIRGGREVAERMHEIKDNLNRKRLPKEHT